MTFTAVPLGPIVTIYKALRFLTLWISIEQGMDILFENSIAPSSGDTDDQLQISISLLRYDGDYSPAPDLPRTAVKMVIAAAVQSLEVLEDDVATQCSLSRHANNVSHAKKLCQQSPESKRGMFFGASTGDEAVTMTRHSGTVRTHNLISYGELVESECFDNGDSFGHRDTQYQEIATADTFVRNRRAPVMSPSLGVAGGLETDGPCDGGPSLGCVGFSIYDVPCRSGDTGWRAESQDGTCTFIGDGHTPTLGLRHVGNKQVTTYRRRPTDLTMESLLALEARLPLPAAAAALGVSPAELRRACRRLGVPRWRHRAAAAAAAAAAAPAARTVAYAANLRRRYGNVPSPPQPAPAPSAGGDTASREALSLCCAGDSTHPEPQGCSRCSGLRM